MKNITLQELLDSFNNITLYELLTNFDEIKKFNLAKKLKIWNISSVSAVTLNANVKEYFLGDVPLYLLVKKVIKVEENDIVVF